MPRVKVGVGRHSVLGGAVAYRDDRTVTEIAPDGKGWVPPARPGRQPSREPMAMSAGRPSRADGRRNWPEAGWRMGVPKGGAAAVPYRRRPHDEYSNRGSRQHGRHLPGPFLRRRLRRRALRDLALRSMADGDIHRVAGAVGAVASVAATHTHRSHAFIDSPVRPRNRHRDIIWRSRRKYGRGLTRNLTLWPHHFSHFSQIACV